MAPPKKKKPSPVGLNLTKVYAIDKLIGEGAFGQVHAITKNGQPSNQWACKLTLVPTKTTKKSSSAAEVAHMRLWSENMVYANQMRHLCGTMLPKIPMERGLYFNNNLGGYRCLTMERMECELMDKLPAFVAAARGKAVPLGDVAVKLLEIVEEVHKTTHLLIDVKPENLMVAYGIEDLAESIRLVDLGLVKTFGGPHGHKANDGTSQVQGTPLYCSGNIHKLNTPARRDDVEAMLYVMGHIVLHVQFLCNGSNKNDCRLPWSQEPSDEAIGRLKLSMVSDRGSAYYAQMDESAATSLFQCYEIVKDYKYSAVPKYTRFYKLLAKLSVKKQQPSAAKKAAATTAKKAPPAKKAAKKPPAKSGRRTRASLEESPMDEDEDGDSEDLTTTTTTTTTMKKVVVQTVKKESPLPTQRRTRSSWSDDSLAAPARNAASRRGRSPSADDGHTKKAKKTVAQSETRYKFDEEQFDSDVSMEKAEVVDLVESSEDEDMSIEDVTPVVKKKKSARVAKGKKPVAAVTVKSTKKKKAASREEVPSDENAKPAAKKTKKAKKAPPPAKKSARVVFTQTDEEYTLEADGCNTFIIGSKPKGNGTHILIDDDQYVAPNHCKLQLLVHADGTVMVEITDLKSDEGTYLNNKQIASGKSKKAFRGSAVVQIGQTTFSIR